jgi:hypothetical protein
MARKVRSDIKVGNLEKKLGVAPGTITNPDGSDARSDKKLGTLRKQFATTKKKPVVKKNATTAKPKSRPKIKADLLVSADQKSAARRTVKKNPKTSASLVKKVSAAIKKAKS